MSKFEPIKAIISANTSGAEDLTVKINGVPIIENGEEAYFSCYKLFDESSSSNEEFELMPVFMKEDMHFLLKEGENTIDISYKKNRYVVGNHMYFAIIADRYSRPLFYFSSWDDEVDYTGVFDISNKEPEGFKTKSNTDDAAFVYFSPHAQSFFAELNGDQQAFFGGKRQGFTALDNKLSVGKNILRINYILSEGTEFSYVIQSPVLDKQVSVEVKELDTLMTDEYDLSF